MLIIQNEDGEVMDKLRWNGTEFVKISKKPFSTKFGGKVSSRNLQQELAIDMIQNDNITVKIAFGWLIDGYLCAVCTFGKPASKFLCDSVCGEDESENVYELNRLCRINDLCYPLSMFVSSCIKYLKKYNWIIVSYSDTAMNHHGYIYQACNFIYTGKTAERTDPYANDATHARHIKCDTQIRQIRSSKHRYIYFATKFKKQKRLWMDKLRFEILPYPKGDNNNDYELGTKLKPKLIGHTESTTELNKTDQLDIQKVHRLKLF